MGAETYLNFAYGSNMLARRLQARVPSARKLATARLDGHQLRWHKIGQDGSGKCDILQVERSQDAVIGVVFEILLSEKTRLDAAEALGRGYDEKLVIVTTDDGVILQAQTYYATHVDPAAVPYGWYKALVVAGAREHGLPQAYIDGLEATVAKDDADLQRAANHFAMANHGVSDFDIC